ncbi:MAG: dihydrolipoyl dehydrogenase [Cytophagales bacterium]|nr:dihydrolipoyl dehydrogenase [Cytophagales bacterium]
MKTEKYDLIVIGTGPGGYVAAIRAAQLGLKVGVVEKEAWGGICLNWGCIPTKALLKSAQVWEEIAQASEYGIQVKGSRVDLESMVKRSRNIAGGMNKGIEFLLKKNKISSFLGTGRWKGKELVEVQTEKGKKQNLQSKHILFATGARARALPDFPIDGQHILGYRDALALSRQPKTLIVIGSGAIGMEFAYFYQALGTQVFVLEAANRIVPQEDEDVSAYVEKHFRKKGMIIHTGVKLELIGADAKEACRVRVFTDKNPKGEILKGEKILSAVGIVPNVEDLGLEEAGVQLTQTGRIQVDNKYRTSVPGIYAIGDVIPGPALAHVASAEAICCVEHIAGQNPEEIDYENIPSCTYTSPEIASVGLSEAQAREKGYELRVGQFPFTASGKAKASGHPEGFVKIIYDKKYGELLGAHLVGHHVTEMIAELCAAKKLETTGHEILKTIHPHPTFSEAIMEATAHAYDEVIHL